MSAAPKQSTPLTEKAALTDLVAWAEKRPAWQKDALRRLVTGETLDTQAITELCLDPARPHIHWFRVGPCFLAALRLTKASELTLSIWGDGCRPNPFCERK